MRGIKKNSAIRKFMRRKKRKDYDKLDVLTKQYWDYVPNFSPKEKKALTILFTYFRLVELLVELVYVRKLNLTPSYWDLPIRLFSRKWARDETGHGEIIERFMVNAGMEVPQITHGGKWYTFISNVMIGFSWVFYPVAAAVHMAIGTINEATTFAAYRALQKHITDPVVIEVIGAIQAEEIPHLTFYRERLEELTPYRWQKYLVYVLLRIFWTPVGANNADAKEVTQTLLSTEKIVNSFYHVLRRNIAQLNAIIPGTSAVVTSRIRAMHE